MIKEYKVDEAHYLGTYQTETIEKNQVFKKFAEEDRNDFFNYLDLLGFTKVPELIVLPRGHHYYYEAEDLKNLKMLVNLKHLNYIKNLMNFLFAIYHILPDLSYFAGSFFVNEKQTVSFSRSQKLQNQFPGSNEMKGTGFSFGMPLLDRMYSLIVFGAKRYLTKGSVSFLPEEALFKVMDMTEINDVTYFCAQKV
jgi:hypothetical protein